MDRCSCSRGFQHHGQSCQELHSPLLPSPHLTLRRQAASCVATAAPLQQRLGIKWNAHGHLSKVNAYCQCWTRGLDSEPSAWEIGQFSLARYGLTVCLFVSFYLIFFDEARERKKVTVYHICCTVSSSCPHSITIKHAWYVSAASPRDSTPLTSNTINIIIYLFYLACALV